MKKLNYKPGMLLLLAAAVLSFTLSGQEVTKDFHKEYKADKNTTLDIYNKYGDVSVESWDKDQVVIDVKVTVEVPGKDRAEKLLGMINVEFTEGTNLITAKTVIDDSFNFSGWHGDRKFSIDYTVKMPKSAGLTLANRYGNTDIDALDGLVNLDIKYGSLSVDKLGRGNEKPVSRIAIAYSKASIDEAGWLDIYSRYTTPFEIGKSKALLIDSRYSKFKIGEASSIVSESKYDTYGIDELNNLVLMSGYTTTSVGTIKKKVNYEGSYGSLNVDNVPAGFESIDVNARYSSVKVGIAESASYKFEGEASYGSIKLNEENFKYQKKIIENTSSEISGVIGKEESPASKVKISTSYGTVRLY
jgi:hypothetical protein